ncbi:hypothetical protein FGIG_06134 [Fasciola gigantica]|uniref:Uncharacterized protein n=1 Tax=Fasciola gigantica TaxID=46835 RepID=A0A504YEM6_FASGI|nr:hypothetical protein FGIG_06134 [Fasciola gigantica]
MYWQVNCFLAIFTLPLHVGAKNFVRNSTELVNRQLPQIPRIVEAPTDQYSADGFLEFTCRAEGNPQPIIQWYNSTDKKLVTDRIPSAESLSGIHVNKHYGRLMISNPTRGTLYSFYCNASNELGWTISDRVVQGGAAYLDKSFQLVPQNQSVDEGVNVTMRCRPPIGIPQPTIFWMREGKVIASQENLTDEPVKFSDYSNPFPSSAITITSKGYLQIYHIQSRDAGRYICGAKNMIAERFAPAVELVVNSTVTFIEIPKHMRVRQGQMATFRCQTDGAYQIRWGRAPGEGSLDYSRVKVEQGHLTIPSVRMSDAGTYVCFVPNIGGYNATLTVDSPPSFVETPSDLSVEVGRIALFRCVAQGHPKPSIYWELPNKTPVFPSDSNNDQKYTVYSDGSLQITDIELTDEGKYQCTAHSSIDTIHSSAKLRVMLRTDTTEASLAPVFDDQTVFQTPMVSDNAPVSINFPVPYISQPPCNQTRMIGESVLFTCDVGNRRSWKQAWTLSRWSVRWVRRSGTVDQPIEALSLSESHRFRVLRTGSLQISSLELRDSGLYRCVLHGAVVQLQEYKSNSVVIQSEWTVKLTVVPIRPSANGELCQDIVLPSPRNLKVKNVTATSVTLIWEPLQTFAAEISSTDHRTIAYRVEYLSLTGPSNSWVTVEHNWPMNTIYLTGLMPNTVYYFLVRSRWVNGRIGRSSDPLGPVRTSRNLINHPSARMPYFSGYRPPNKPVDLHERIKHVQIDHVQFQVLSDSQVHIQWSVTDAVLVLNQISGFTVRAQEVGVLRCVGSILEQNNQATPTERYSPSSTNYCSLQHSDSEGLAGMVSRLEGLQRAYTDSHNDAYQPAIISTEISHSPIAVAQNEVIAQQYQATVRALRPFKCYDLRISAYIMHTQYKKLESLLSDPKFVLTSESAPSAPPTGVSVSWVAKSRAQIRWRAPNVSSWNGLLTGYVVQIYGELTQEPQIVNASHSILSIDVDLPPRPEAYLVQVAAVTCAGVGVPSPLIRLFPFTYKSDLNTSLNGASSVNKAAELLTQPWFVGTMIGSIVAWCVIIALVAFFCLRKRYKKVNKNQRAVLSPMEVQSSLPADATNREVKTAFEIRDDNVNMKTLLIEGKYTGEHGGKQLSESNIAFVQSRSYAEYFVQPHDTFCPQHPTNQIGAGLRHTGSRSNMDSLIGVRSQSLSSSGGRSSMDAWHQPVLVTPAHALSSPEPVDTVNQVGIPQSYSLSPSQYAWQSSPGTYPHDMLPPFQQNSGTPPNIPPLPPNGINSYWIKKKSGSIDRADGNSDTFYPPLGESADDGDAATPYATASILSTTERHEFLGCSSQKIPLSTICNAGTICYPCGNAQSSSDQASYTSNSDRYRTRRCRGNVNGRQDENGTVQRYPVHSLGDSATSRSSKASHSPTTSTSRSSSKQQNKSQTTALTTTTTAASTEHSLSSSRVTPQEEENEEEEERRVDQMSKITSHGEETKAESKTVTERNPYLPHFDQPVDRDWSRSTRYNLRPKQVKQSVTTSLNGENPRE